VLAVGFKDIQQINANLSTAVTNLQTFNDQLNTANKATGDMAANSDKLIKSTDTLVEQVLNQVHRLGGLTGAFEQFGQAVQQLAPDMERLKTEMGIVQQFAARMDELVKALGQARDSLSSTMPQLEEVPAVVKDFIGTTRQLLAEGRSSS
jgi:methyl-accepting chemotaxis protein